MTDAEKIKAFAQKLKLEVDDVYDPNELERAHKQLCDMVTQMAKALEFYGDAGYAYQEERLKIAERALRLVQKHGLFHYEDCKNSNYEDEQCTCGMERAEFEVKEALEKLGVK